MSEIVSSAIVKMSNMLWCTYILKQHQDAGGWSTRDGKKHQSTEKQFNEMKRQK